MSPLRKSLTAAAIAAAVSVGAPLSATAATATANFVVSATVLSFCSVLATPLLFGNYSGAQIDASSTVTVTCTAGTAYTVGLNAGTGTGATVTQRRMIRTAGTELLNYGLFTDAARAVNWSDTGAGNTVAGSGNALPQPLTVYGRIPANQLTATAGVYQDLVTVTVTY